MSYDTNGTYIKKKEGEYVVYSLVLQVHEMF